MKKGLMVAIVTLIFMFIAFVTYNLAEPKVYDFMTKYILVNKLPFDKYKKNIASDAIILIVIDDKTVTKYRWPWKRELNCKIYEYFNKYAKPKVIVHDSIILNLDKDNPESDRKFFSTLSKFDNLVVGFMPSFYMWKDKDFGKKYDESFSKFRIDVEDKTTRDTYIYESMMAFPEDYMKVIKYAGSVSMLPGSISGNICKYFMDEIYRNHEYFLKYNNEIYPSIAMQAFLLAHNNPKMVVTDKSIEFPEYKYKVNLRENRYQSVSPIRFYKIQENGYSHIKFSAVDVMDSYDALSAGKKPILDPKIFENKIVIIGANVPAGAGLNDNKNTPVLINHPGVDIQATAIDNILHNEFLVVIPQWLNFLITLIGMFLVFSYIKTSGLVRSIVSTISIILLYFILSVICFYFGVVINVLTPIVMFVITTILAYTYKFVLENNSKEKVKSVMGKYMSQDVMKQVIQNIDNLGLGGKRSVVTVLFSDIRGFTSISEQMTPQEVSEILNEYFTEMEPIITQYSGVINKFIGDAIMAVFGEPIQDEHHAQNAVKSAYAMIKRVEQLQKKWEKEGKPKIDIGIGIATGEVFVGNIGSINRMEYTVIGDTVNLASRLESYNKNYKTKLLISSATYKEVKAIVDVVKIPEVEIRGKVNKIDIYEVLKVKDL